MDRDKLKNMSIITNTTLKQAIQKLNETAKKILFVISDSNKLLGTITDGDLRRGIIDGKQLNDTILEIMNTCFISVETDCSGLNSKAVDLMRQKGVEQIPVVNTDGIITDVISWIDCLGLEVKPLKASKTRLLNQVVIMAGGKGTRLDPFTKILPKPLIPLRDKPIVEHIMNRFCKYGFYEFKLIVNYKKEMIRMYFNEDGITYPYEIEFVEEDDFLGTAGGLYLLKNRLNESFVITNCDTVLEGDYRDFLNWHKERNNLMTIVGSHKEITVPYGVLSMNNGNLRGIEEKPKYDLFVNTGTYIFEPDILDFIKDNEYMDMDKLISKVIEVNPRKVGVYPHWGEWFDLGGWEEYKKSIEKLGD